MTALALRIRRGRTLLGELAKLSAFVRRDFLVAWSYRLSFLTSLLSLVGAAFIFYFVGQMVDPSKLPEVAGTQVSYLEFAAVGMALSGFIHLGLERVSTVVRSEQMMGTLESLLSTPTSSATVQVGSVLFDLFFIPIRMGVFLGALVLAFGVDLKLSAIPQALALVAVFVPFVWGLGVLAAGMTLTFRRGSGVVAAATLGLTLLSGVYFPVGLLPGWLHSIAAASPIAITVTAMRDALLGGAGWAEISPKLLEIAPASIAAVAIGTLAFRLALRRERRLGTLGAY